MLFCSTSLFGQKADVQSAAVLAGATLALGPGQPVNDIVLTGTVSHFDGVTKDSGSATLKVKGADESRIDLALSTPRSDVRTIQGAIPRGSWSKANQAAQRHSLNNLFTPACWASPVNLIASLNRSGSTVSYVGQEQRFGVTVDHLRSTYVSPTMKTRDASALAAVQRLGTFDIYLDSLTHLPLSLMYNTHADDDANIDIPVEVRFANYTNVNGVLVPFHIQRLFRNQTNIDFTVTAAAINSGLLDSDFNVQ